MTTTLARLCKNGRIIPAALRDNLFFDLSSVVPDISVETIGSGKLVNVDLSLFPAVTGDFSIMAPVSGVRQIAATGFNYKKHIAEFSAPTPKEPELF